MDVILGGHITKDPRRDDEGREGFPEYKRISERTVGPVPDHSNQTRIAIKRVVIFLRVEGLAFSL